MKSKNALRGISIAVALQLGVLAGSAQTNQYLFTGSETNITLPPGTYNITAYGGGGGNGGGSTGSAGGNGSGGGGTGGSGGAGGSGSNGSGGGGFNSGGTSGSHGGMGGGSFLSGGAGGAGDSNIGGANGSSGSGGYGGGGGGGSNFTGGGGSGGGGGGYSGGGGGAYGVGGGGGSIIDSSAIANLAEVSGIASPDDSPDGEIIITAVPPPPTVGITTVDSLPVVIWPSAGTNFTLQMTTNLASGNWVTVTNGVPFFGLQITNAPGTAFFRLH